MTLQIPNRHRQLIIRGLNVFVAILAVFTEALHRSLWRLWQRNSLGSIIWARTRYLRWLLLLPNLKHLLITQSGIVWGTVHVFTRRPWGCIRLARHYIVWACLCHIWCTIGTAIRWIRTFLFTGGLPHLRLPILIFLIFELNDAKNVVEHVCVDFIEINLHVHLLCTVEQHNDASCHLTDFLIDSDKICVSEVTTLTVLNIHRVETAQHGSH